MFFSLKKLLFFTLLSLLWLSYPATLQAHDISRAQTAVLISDQMSQSQCVKIAHQVCDKVFGSCAKDQQAAIGGTYGYLIIYQCHNVIRTRGSDRTLVISGSRTEATNSKQFTKLINQSYNLASKLFH